MMEASHIRSETHTFELKISTSDLQAMMEQCRKFSARECPQIDELVGAVITAARDVVWT